MRHKKWQPTALCPLNNENSVFLFFILVIVGIVSNEFDDGGDGNTAQGENKEEVLDVQRIYQ